MLEIYKDVIMFGFYSFFLEVFIGVAALMRNAEKRSLFPVRLVACFALSSLVYFIPPVRISVFSFNYMFVLVIAVAECFFCYKTTVYNAAFYVAAGFALQHIGWNLMLIVIEGVGLEHFNRAGGIAVYIASYFVTYLAAALAFSDYENGSERKSRAFVFAISAVIIVMDYLISAILSSRGLWNIYSRIYAILTCMFALCLQFGTFRYGRLQSQNARLAQDKVVLEQLLYQEKKQQELSKDTIEIIERKCHDLKHQISALRTMDKEEREKRIGEIEKSVMIYGDIAKTENKVLNVVLTEKGLICEKYKIKFSYIVEGNELNFMDPVDLSSLFGNAIDNAIESVVKEDEQRRIIRLNVTTKNNFIGIHLENYCSEAVDFENGLPVTKKEDKSRHGFGVKSIRYIAEKYGGFIHLGVKDCMFILNVLIPQKEQ